MLHQETLEYEELADWINFKSEHRISDNLSETETPSFKLGVWAYETGCDCPTCRKLRA